MKIPILIHKDSGSVFGVSVPDIPGCHSFGESIMAAMKNVKEVIVSHIETARAEGEIIDVVPTPIEELMKDHNLDRTGIWALVGIDEGPPNMTAERFNTSMPHAAMMKIDEYVAKIGETRSGFLCRTALEAIDLAERRKNTK